MNVRAFAAAALPAAAVIATTTIATMIAGCGTPKPVSVDFSETPRDYRSKDYHDVYERWTRHNLVRRDVDAALDVWATYKSWDFREAYIEHYSSIYSLAEAEKSALRTAQLEAFRAAFEFQVTAQSTSYKWNDLEKRNSAWRVTLLDGLGHELAPERIRLEKLPDPYEIEFFPAKGPFTRSYGIRFVKGAESEFVGAATGSLTLRIASPVGRVEVVWQGN